MEMNVNILSTALVIALSIGGLVETALAHSASPQPSRTSSAQVGVPPVAAVPASEDTYGSGNKQQDNNSQEAVKAYWDKVLYKSH
jgi:hypothetical protein